jgi:hypothetical protein
MESVGITGSEAIRRRVAAVALSVVLFALVASWSGLEATQRRSREPRSRRGRPSRDVVPRVFVAETRVTSRPPYAVNFAACPRPLRRRVVRLVPFRPSRSPFERN